MRGDSQGTTTCYSCGGGGRDRYHPNSNCRGCGGSGRANCTTCGGRGSQSCWTCSGNGRCGNCGGGGRVQCSTCHGSGKRTCPTCRGKGEVQCSSCKGFRYFTSYQLTRRKWAVSSFRSYHIPARIGQNFPHFKGTTEEVRNGRQSFVERVLPAEKFHQEPQSFQQIYQQLLKAGQSTKSLDLDAAPFLLHQRLQLGIIPLYLIEYTYQGATYPILVSAHSQRVVDEVGPIAQYRQELFETGQRLYRRRNFDKSRHYLELAFELDPDNTFEEINQLYEKVLKKVRTPYYWGTTLGALSGTYLIGLSSLNWLPKLPYGMGILSEKTASTGPAFDLADSLLFSLLLLLMALIPCLRRIPNSLGRAMQHHVPTELLRTTIGLISGLLWTLLVWGLCTLIHLTGILIPLALLLEQGLLQLQSYLPQPLFP